MGNKAVSYYVIGDPIMWYHVLQTLDTEGLNEKYGSGGHKIQ